MTALFFPDNTVLINFAMINRMDLLERLANGNGAWCATVAAECRKSADFPGLAAMSDADRFSVHRCTPISRAPGPSAFAR
jgi:hypothetical protein